MRRILVVDDEPTIRMVIRIFLEMQGYAVLEADDVAGAIGVLRCERFDMVITDWIFPGGRSGGELLTCIAEQRIDRRPAVLVLTGRPDERIHFTQSPCDVLPKPFDLWELQSIVDRVIHRPAGIAGQ